jgi:2-keto-4-pentenoate hydratase/2-oxohepta-3-ene-1,7-dioic acid hydratase in catechol pathway
MRRVRFRDPAGAVRTGSFEEDTVRFGGRSYTVEEVDLLAPVEPSKLVCVGRNYAAHADERGEDVPDRPLLFLKPPNTVAGHADEITLPAGKDRIEHEAELAVVIDEQCRHVAPEAATDVIAGYTCANDLSNRDDQDREQNWVRGKAFDGAAPLGPAIAPPESVPDDARIRLWVDGECRQDATLDHLIFSVPELIAEITTYLTLEPGDVILTGTPAGVGPLTDGARVTIEIDGIGRLEHTVTTESV